MAGYNYNMGMSNNAIDAHISGLKTASKIKNGGLTKGLIEKHCLYTEWHHTGSTFYNQTNFYEADYVLATFGLKETADFPFSEYKNENAVKDLKALKESKKKSKSIEIEIKVHGEYAIFSGSKRHPKVAWEKFEGILKENWIFLKNGSKKKADGNWINYTIIN